MIKKTNQNASRQTTHLGKLCLFKKNLRQPLKRNGLQLQEATAFALAHRVNAIQVPRRDFKVQLWTPWCKALGEDAAVLPHLLCTSLPRILPEAGWCFGMVLLCCSLFHQRLPFKRAAFFVNVQLYSNIRNYFAWVGLMFIFDRNLFHKASGTNKCRHSAPQNAADSRCSASAASGNQRICCCIRKRTSTTSFTTSAFTTFTTSAFTTFTTSAFTTFTTAWPSTSTTSTGGDDGDPHISTIWEITTAS